MTNPTTADWLAAFAQLDRMPLVDWTTTPATCTVTSNPIERNHMTEPEPMRMPPKMLRLAHLQRAGECLDGAEQMVTSLAGDINAMNSQQIVAMAGLATAHFAAAHAVELLPHQ
jgi:hypothetical protein